MLQSTTSHQSHREAVTPASADNPPTPPRIMVTAENLTFSFKREREPAVSTL